MQSHLTCMYYTCVTILKQLVSVNYRSQYNLAKKDKEIYYIHVQCIGYGQIITLLNLCFFYILVNIEDSAPILKKEEPVPAKKVRVGDAETKPKGWLLTLICLLFCI